MRYRWWTIFPHLALLGLGLANLYPFVWMVGTSLKAQEEASTNRASPIPLVKYQLAERYRPEGFFTVPLSPEQKSVVEQYAPGGFEPDEVKELQKVLPGALSPEELNQLEAIGAGKSGFETVFPIPVNLNDLKQLDRLQRRDDPAVPFPTAEYPKIVATPAKQANASLERLRRAGLIEVAVPAEGDQGEQLRLAEGARGRINAELYPRQIITLWDMYEENVRRAESRSTYAYDTRTWQAYAKAFDIQDPPQAQAELRELQERGFTESATVQAINYWVVLKEENFLLYFQTSFIVTCAVVVGTVLVSSMLGYALARMKFPGRFLVLGLMIAAAVAPREAVIIPIFKMLKSAELLTGLWGMVIWLTSFGVGNALLMAGFFLTLPKEVDEAASVDGAGPFRTFFDIALPMARPIVMTVALFAFLTAWNNFLIPLLCTITRPSMQPLSVAVYNFQQGHPGKWHQINAAASVMIVPVIVLFLLLQRHVIKSIAVGAVKG